MRIIEKYFQRQFRIDLKINFCPKLYSRYAYRWLPYMILNPHDFIFVDALVVY